MLGLFVWVVCLCSCHQIHHTFLSFLFHFHFASSFPPSFSFLHRIRTHIPFPRTYSSFFPLTPPLLYLSSITLPFLSHTCTDRYIPTPHVHQTKKITSIFPTNKTTSSFFSLLSFIFSIFLLLLFSFPTFPIAPTLRSLSLSQYLSSPNEPLPHRKHSTSPLQDGSKPEHAVHRRTLPQTPLHRNKSSNPTPELHLPHDPRPYFTPESWAQSVEGLCVEAGGDSHYAEHAVNGAE